MKVFNLFCLATTCTAAFVAAGGTLIDFSDKACTVHGRGCGGDGNNRLDPSARLSTLNVHFGDDGAGVDGWLMLYGENAPKQKWML